MKRLLLAILLVGTVPCLGKTRVETLATFDNGASLQGMDRADDGSLYLTDYANDLLLKIDAHGEATTLTKLPIHPQGILVTHNGFLISGHVERPSSDAALTLTQRFQHLQGRVLILDRQGAVLKSIDVGTDTFPNGMTQLRPHEVLLADSLAGAIWVLDPDAGSVNAWTRDPLVHAEPAFPGANGVKIHDKWVYVSNTSKGAIVRIPLSAAHLPAGPAAMFSTAPRVDEMAVTHDGTIYAASHGAMLKISPSGRQGTAMEDVAGGSTLMLAPDQKSIFVATDAAANGTEKGRAYVLRVWLD